MFSILGGVREGGRRLGGEKGVEENRPCPLRRGIEQDGELSTKRLKIDIYLSIQEVLGPRVPKTGENQLLKETEERLNLKESLGKRTIERGLFH